MSVRNDPEERSDRHSLMAEALWGVGLIAAVFAWVVFIVTVFGR
jgi:hypothetical protein